MWKVSKMKIKLKNNTVAIIVLASLVLLPMQEQEIECDNELLAKLFKSPIARAKGKIEITKIEPTLEYFQDKLSKIDNRKSFEILEKEFSESALASNTTLKIAFTKRKTEFSPNA